MHVNKKTKHLAAIIAVLLSTFLYISIHVPLPAARLSSSNVESIRIVDRHGTLLREVLSTVDGRGRWIELKQISPHVLLALIHTEDRNFFYHNGVDPAAVVRAAYQNISSGRIVSGGSTISQQLTRQIYRLPRSPFGKIAEMWLALRLEHTLNKAEILDQYLNRAPFGNQTFGIAAASRLYFNKPPAHLTFAEAALLAGLPQAPSAYDPFRHLDRARARQRRVLRGMLNSGVIDSTRFNTAINEVLIISSRPKNFLAPHGCDLALSLLASTPPSREVRLTIDAALQNQVEKLLAGNLIQLERANVTNGAVLVIDNQTGDILALVGSADYFDDAHDGQVNGALALRQPGSALKPFTYGLAFERGFTAATILPDIPTHAPLEAGAGDFTPTNYDGHFHGPVRLRTALACSYNVPAVRVMETLGADPLLQRLRSAGFTSLNKTAQHYGLGLTLGNGETSLLELTRAYLALANDSVVRNVRLFTDNSLAPLSPISEQQVFSREIAFLLADILRDDAARTPAFSEGSVLDLPFPCAVKTGTTKDFRDNWTVGYTSDYTVGVWVGNFGGEAMRQVSGVSGAGPIFRDIMLTLHRNALPLPITKSDGLITQSICTVSGSLPNEFCPNQMTEYFLPNAEPAAMCDWHRLIEAPAKDEIHFASTLTTNVTSQLALIYPPLYQPWARSEGIAQPLLLGKVKSEERRTKSDEQPATSDPHLASRISHLESKIQITFPDDGDIFKIDPVLHLEFQTLLLECVVDGDFDKVTWLIDGKPIATAGPPFHARWQLKKGEHVVQLRASHKISEIISSSKRFLVL